MYHDRTCTIGEYLTNLLHGVYFAVLDIPSAFHQILVDEDSRDVLASTAMNRKYRFKWLLD